jgi:hypothetical protein
MRGDRLVAEGVVVGDQKHAVLLREVIRVEPRALELRPREAAMEFGKQRAAGEEFGFPRLGRT